MTPSAGMGSSAGVGRPGRRPRSRGDPPWGARTLRALEWDDTLALVAAHAASEPARELLRGLTPSADRDWIEAELDRVVAMGQILEKVPSFAMPALADTRAITARLARDGAVLDGPELISIRALLGGSRALRDLLSGAEPPLQALRARLLSDEGLERLIDQTVDGDGEVLDRASPELARVRRELRGARARLVKQLEETMSRLPDRVRVADASVTVRQGRFVIPVRREGRGTLPGIVHDESSSGQTLFVEPTAAVEGMNRFREAELEEAREIHRILADRSARLRPHAADLLDSFRAGVELDALHARARYAAVTESVRPELGASDGPLRIQRGRHPLLLARGTVVPFDLELAADERGVVVSGPNAGGKTVLLKSVGLAVALLHSGVLPPLGRGSVLPLVSRVFADIGDRQSIAESLSTFSAHLSVLKDILDQADSSALVLIDEMGTGTDPAEGAALAEAVVEELVSRGARILATSHLGALKRLADDDPRVVNASLRFDGDRMEPTFEFIKGRPGRSYGLAMARRTGLPDEVLARAERRVDDTELRMEQLLARIEAEERRAAADAEAARRHRLELESRLAEVAAREAELRERERTAVRDAKTEARKILLDARAQVEEAIEEVRTATDLERSAREARRAVEAAAEQIRVSERSSPADRDLAVQPGDRVRVGESGGIGTVVEVEEGRVLVELDNGLKVRVADVRRLDAAPPRRERRRAAIWTPPEHLASHEVDLRGLRVDEVESALLRALDHAVLADLPSVRVIHGKGTGALRARVTELLAEEPRVAALRPGGEGEGGTGVTVVTLR
ncbi:MAG: endonuclease MutS2 [Gemmatimonadota bacterium]